jgi:glucokinase
MGKATGKYLGIDVGGTKIAAGLVDAATWKVIKTVQRPTEAHLGRARVLANILETVGELSAGKIKGVGVGFAGVVDFKRGVVLAAPNFSKDLANFPLAKELARHLHAPVVVDNDARCFALAEAVAGSAKGKGVVFGMTIGTGIGGSLIINGQPFRGRDNAAGEIGHAIFSLGSLAECGDGQLGHFEAAASGTALRKMTSAIVGREMSVTELMTVAAAGNAPAQAVVDAFRGSLTIGLQNLAYLYNPDTIVIGGGVGEHEELWRPAVAKAASRIIYPKVKNLVVRRSKLGHRANILGAAMLAAAR